MLAIFVQVFVLVVLGAVSLFTGISIGRALRRYHDRKRQ